jgi:hemerythrin
MATLKLGDPALDQDHAKLHDLIEQLLAAPSSSVVADLDALRVHARQHFSVEDGDLVAMNDGNAKCHMDDHAAVLKSLDEVRDVLTGEEVDAVGKAMLVQRLGAHLLDWLPGHVHEMDAGVATHRSKQRFGGAPVVIQKMPR